MALQFGLFAKAPILGVVLFEDAWKAYPDRHVCENKRDTIRQWQKRVHEGVLETAMVEGTLRYRDYCDKMRLTGTEFVMQPRRFFGPSRHFELPWKINQHKVIAREELSTRLIHKLKTYEADALPPEEASAMLQKIRTGLRKA